MTGFGLLKRPFLERNSFSGQNLQRGRGAAQRGIASKIFLEVDFHRELIILFRDAPESLKASEKISEPFISE